MIGQINATTVLGFLLISTACAWGAQTKSEPGALPEAMVRFEQNVTDGDVEVVFEVTGDDEGLVELMATSPDGRTVVDFKAPDSSTLGIRRFQFESPEPRDITALKAAYPEGVYEFSGKTSSGAALVGKSTLSHRLPKPTTIVQPAPEAEDVSLDVQGITWVPVPDAVSYIVEIEHEELNVNITALLPGSSQSFPLPKQFLSAGMEYQIGIGTVSAEGNISFVETTFATAEASESNP
jgi:hypothetical protein